MIKFTYKVLKRAAKNHSCVVAARYVYDYFRRICQFCTRHRKAINRTLWALFAQASAVIVGLIFVVDNPSVVDPLIYAHYAVAKLIFYCGAIDTMGVAAVGIAAFFVLGAYVAVGCTSRYIVTRHRQMRLAKNSATIA